MPEAIDERLAVLRRLPLLVGLGDAEILELAQAVQEKRFKPRDVLVQEGGTGSDVFLITTGRCEVRRGNKVLATLGPGGLFGEMAVLSPDPRTATVAAIDPVTTFVLSGWEFRQALHAHPALAIHVMKGLVARLRKAEEDLAAARAR